MDRVRVPIGILFSQTGSYRTIGEAMFAGAWLAIEEVNASSAFSFQFAPQVIDPAGELANYVDAARSMLADGSMKHVVGCYTSSSRKEVLPTFEKHDALLWYPSHYEGFERSDNVVYTGAAPNQHVIPLTRHMLRQGRRRAFLVGSNYIWAWENNRIMYEALTSAGGEVVGERYSPVGDVDVDAVIEQIIKCRPGFVFCTLIGESAYAFYRGLRRAAEARGFNQPEEFLVASCSLAEPELRQIGVGADGHLSSSVYFSTIDTPENRRFVAAWQKRFPDLGPTSADAEASYSAVQLLARAIEAGQGDDLDSVRGALESGTGYDAPQGPVLIDPENRHCWMRPRLGRSTAHGSFDIVSEGEVPVRPDPYLVWEPAIDAEQTASSPPQLRLVR